MGKQISPVSSLLLSLDVVTDSLDDATIGYQVVESDELPSVIAGRRGQAGHASHDIGALGGAQVTKGRHT